MVKLLRKFALAALGIITAMLVCHIALRPDRQLAAQEQYAGYSSYIEQGLTGEFRRFGDGAGVVLIQADASVLAGDDRLHQLGKGITALSGLKGRFPVVGFPLLYSFLWANIGKYRFEPKFRASAKCEIINESDLADGALQRRFPGSYSYLAFSPVGFNRRLDEAVFYAAHICPLCGGGEYVLMRKAQEQWRIVALHSVWVS
jgi:hypothetical protein